MSEETRTTLKPRPMCPQCRSNLIHGAKYKKKDPWMALEVTTLLTLINLALKDKKYAVIYGNDVEGINRIQCLGCFLPESLKRIIKTAKETRDLNKIKAIGEEGDQ